MKKRLISFFAAAMSIATPQSALPAESAIELPSHDWKFEGVFGSYDKAAMQRGFQVYKEVCSTCHSLNLVNFRNLQELGFNEDEVKAIAAEYNIVDGPNGDGEMFERTAVASDPYPAPYPNAEAAAAANGGKAPPDLSLMAKARAGGADYIRALLTGFEDAPEGFDVGGGAYNKYYPGHVIAMAQPLYEDSVTYADGTPATIENMSADVAHFLMWTAEPKLENRKKTGVFVMVFLFIFTLVMYAAKRLAWKDVH